MRPATLTALLVLALLAVPLAEVLFVAPDAAVATLDRGPVSSDAAPAAMVRGPIPRDEPGSRPSAATAAAGMTSGAAAPSGAIATMDRGPSSTTPGAGSEPLELVAILPPGHDATPPPAPPLTRAEALASIMHSPEYQDTVPPLARLYFATFGRYPDYEGLNYYTGVREGGMTLPEIAQEFASGREFEIRYGSLGNAEFVERLFVNVLGDAHQPDVRAYWVSELDAGRMTRGHVIVDLSESGAFRERSDNRVFVSTAYSEIYRRTPDPYAYASWVSMLDAGYSRRAFIDVLLARR